MLTQLDNLVRWVKRQLPAHAEQPPLHTTLATLEQIKQQDLEPDPSHPGGGSRIKRGTAKDRRISVTDPEMRHGRKNKNKVFNGYKQHLAADLDTELIHAAAVTPANHQEQLAAEPLKRAIEARGFTIAELYIDRGYLNSPAVEQVLDSGGDVVCRPWAFARRGLFGKGDFRFNLKTSTVTCPGGIQMPFTEGTVVVFPAERCAACPTRQLCTRARDIRRGRSLQIQPDERFYEKLRRGQRSRRGRARLRRRARIEHRLAHVARRSGFRARYRGVRKNEFSLRRTAALLNLEVLARRQAGGIRSVSNRSVS